MSARVDDLVSFGDVDPYLIHWSAYPGLVDRGHTRLLAPAIRDSRFPADGVVTSRFRFGFHQPAALGDELAVVTWPARVGRRRAVLGHEVRLADGRVTASASTELVVDVGPGPGVTGFGEFLVEGRSGEMAGTSVEPARGQRRARAWQLGPPSAADRHVLNRGTEPRHRAELHRVVFLHQTGARSLHWLAWIDWVDEGFGALLAGADHPVSVLRRDDDLGFPLVDVVGGLSADVCLDAEVDIVSRVLSVGRSSLAVGHRLQVDGITRGWAVTRHVCVRARTFEPTAVPQWLR